MSSFSIIDNGDKISKYKVVHVPIFSSSQGNWNKLLKPKGFNIVNSLTRTVLFTGYLSGFSIADNQPVEIKIRFNINGRADYTEESIKFFITTANVHRIIPINFVKTFQPTLISPTLPLLSEIGLYDVYIYVNPTSVGYLDSYFRSDSNDVLYLNATFYHNNTIENFSSPVPVPSDFQLYGDYINTAANSRVQHIAFVSEINQYVFMTVAVLPGFPTYLKMVSQDNKQARYIPANPTDIASQIFNEYTWNSGYTVDGHYNVLKPSDYELYGPGIGKNGNGRIPVEYVVYDTNAGQAVFMAIDSGFLKMVSQDNKQARYIPASLTDTPSSLYERFKWNSYNNPGIGYYNVSNPVITSQNQITIPYFYNPRPMISH